jgi:glycosyltransferase involved in cell wall biosynthesis
MQKPKILYIITKSNWGGAQKYVFDISTCADVQKDFDILVLCGGDGELSEKLKQENVKVLNSNIIKNTLSPVQLLKIVFEIIKIIKKESPDILHINSSLVGIAGSIAGIILNKKVIFTAHGWPFNEQRPKIVQIIFKILMLATVTLSTKTIAVSRQIQNSLTDIKFIKNKIVLIYNGIKDRSESKTRLEKLSKNTNTLHLVSVGELNHNKNHISVLEILYKINNKNTIKNKSLHYHIIGSGSLESELKSYILENNLQDLVTMHGHLVDAGSTLSKYDLFILPSKTEALGYVAIEALRAGLPVLAHNIGGIPEVLENSDNSVLYNTDLELENILLDYAKEGDSKYDTEYREKESPGKKLKNLEDEWVDSRFDFKNMISKTLEVYKSTGTSGKAKPQ